MRKRVVVECQAAVWFAEAVVVEKSLVGSVASSVADWDTVKKSRVKRPWLTSPHLRDPCP